MDYSLLKKLFGGSEPQPVEGLEKQDLDRQLYQDQAEEKRLSREQDINAFLDNIAQIESSGGKNFNHKMVTDPSSMHYGKTAIGTFGFMPDTVKEIAIRNKDPKLQALLKMKDEQIKAALEMNPQLEREFASKLAEHVYDNQAGNLEKAAQAWYTGHNRKKISDKELEKSDYVKKFRNLTRNGV